MLGSHCAMSPGERTMPAAIVLPTAAAIPNHIPSTLRSPPPERVTDSCAVGEPVATEAVAGVASDVLDNGFSGLRCECTHGCGVDVTRGEAAMIMACAEIARKAVFCRACS